MSSIYKDFKSGITTTVTLTCWKCGAQVSYSRDTAPAGMPYPFWSKPPEIKEWSVSGMGDARGIAMCPTCLVPHVEAIKAHKASRMAEFKDDIATMTDIRNRMREWDEANPNPRHEMYAKREAMLAEYHHALEMEKMEMVDCDRQGSHG